MNPTAANLETFTLEFGGKARVTVRVDYSRVGSPADADGAGFFAIACHGPLGRAERRRCRRWFAETFTVIAQRADRSIVLCFPADDGLPCALVCEPHAPPEWVSLP